MIFSTLAWFLKITERHNLQERLKENAAESSQFQRFSPHQTAFHRAKNCARAPFLFIPFQKQPFLWSFSRIIHLKLSKNFQFWGISGRFTG